MLDSKSEVFAARITKVLDADMFEAVIDLGFEVSITKKLKLGGVDSESLRAFTKDQRCAAQAFLVDNILDKSVVLKVVKRGDYYYARISLGPEMPNVSEAMFAAGLLVAFKKPSQEIHE